ncbi:MULTISPECIES: hypothetical protein [Burkholderia]|uniref:hypothetical protein n=1 Tax=Burkholderia savannae TaxID=1637837 RepID=UPI0012E34B2F|nr:MULTISPECIES: hypothetical protein [Burkholderia]
MRIGGGGVPAQAGLRLLDLLLQVKRAIAELLGLTVRDAVRPAFDRIGHLDLVDLFFPLGSFD